MDELERSSWRAWDQSQNAAAGCRVRRNRRGSSLTRGAVGLSTPRTGSSGRRFAGRACTRQNSPSRNTKFSARRSRDFKHIARWGSMKRGCSERPTPEAHSAGGAHSMESCLGGHLKTGHRSTLQNRPPRAWRPRPSVVDRVVVLWSSVLLSFNTTSRGCANVGISRSLRDFQSPGGNRVVVSMGLSFA